MGERTITDEEIALIKAMLARNMKNRDIQFFFNRPGRAVNTGRITGISAGSYSDSAKIPRASDELLNAFLASRSPSVDVPVTVGFAKAEAEVSGPLSEATLRRMFKQGAGKTWYLTAGETEQAECKTSFGLRHTDPWLRAIAALANNRGGYVLFGVGDKDAAGAHQVLGLANDEFADADPAEFAKRLRATFAPTPRFQRTVIVIGDKRVGVLHVEQHPSRPVIATKNEGGGDIKEGDIFFRYPGQSARINYADLRAMLDARDAQARAGILPMIQRLLDLGPARAMVADLDEGRLMDGKHVIELDEDIIQRLSFIKEGEFDERTGAPALRLIGDVKAAASEARPVPTKKGLVTRVDLQRDFLADKLNADPLDYVRCAIEVTGNDWLPIRHFAHAAGLSHSQLLSFIDGNKAAQPAQKLLYKKRLSSPDKAYAPASGPAAEALRRLLAGEASDPKNVEEAYLTVRATQALPRPFTADVPKLRLLLARCAALIGVGSNKAAKSALRRALARFDEVTVPVLPDPASG